MNSLFKVILHYTIALTICAVLLHAAPSITHANDEAPATKPMKTAAYFEAGPYWEYSLIYKYILDSLTEQKVLQRITFPEALHISPGWDAAPSVYREEARKLMANPSIDVILSMDIVATQALLAENNGRTLIMAIDIADPVAANIVTLTGKGAPNLTVYYIKDRWNKIFALFHEALPFRRLGIMYHNSPEGLSYSNVREAQEVARDRGFTLVEYPYLDKEESLDACAKGVDQLIEQGIDSFYVSALNCFDWTQYNPQAMLDKLKENNIRTFARDGSMQVRRGVLMGLSTQDYGPLGQFYADQMAYKLDLLPNRVIIEKHIYSPKITINLDTANDLGIDIPLVLLISADEIFDSTLAGIQNATMAQ